MLKRKKVCVRRDLKTVLDRVSCPVCMGGQRLPERITETLNPWLNWWAHVKFTKLAFVRNTREESPQTEQGVDAHRCPCPNRVSNYKGTNNFQLFPRSILVATEGGLVLAWSEKIRQCTTFRVVVLTHVVSTLRSRVSIPAILYEMYQWHVADGWLHMWSQVSWWLLSKDAWEVILTWRDGGHENEKIEDHRFAMEMRKTVWKF